MSGERDFSALARAAKAELEQRRLDSENNKRVAEALENARLATAEAVLSKEVLPILEQARSSFEAEGIGMQIRRGRYMAAISNRIAETVEIRCYDPTNTTGGGKGGAGGGGTVTLSHDGERLGMTTSWSSWASPISGEPGELAATAAQRALEHYLS